jgi:hypothetical protein
MIANTIAMTRAVGRFDERFTPCPFKELRESALLQQRQWTATSRLDGLSAVTSDPFARIPAAQRIGAALS